MATRTYKQYLDIAHNLGASQADIFQVPSGKTWLVLRARNISNGSTEALTVDRTTSANAQQIRVESRTGGAGETVSTEMTSLRGAVFTDQDKIRAAATGGGAGDWTFTLFVIEETP